MRSGSELRAVSMTTGTSLSARSRRMTSRPSSSGSMRSRTTRAGILRARSPEGLAPVVGGHHAIALPLEVGAHEGHDLAVVVHDQDGSLRGAGAAPLWEVWHQGIAC